MRTDRQWLEYRELELISTPQPQPKRKHRTVLSILKSIGNSLLAALTEESQLRVWQTVERDGNICWHVYDSRTEQSIQLASEQEVRVWIDESFSRKRTCSASDWISYHYPYLIPRRRQI